MDVRLGVACALSGMLAGVPVAAVAFAVPTDGPVVLSRRAWLGFGVDRRWLVMGAIATGVVAGTVGARLGWSVVLPAYWFSAVLGVALLVVDVRRRRLPYVFTAPMYVVCVLCLVGASLTAGDHRALVRAAVAAGATQTGFVLLAVAFAGQLGLGDVVLAGWIALTLGWLGWDRLALGLLVGLTLQALLAVTLMISGRARLGDRLPMGPALLVGWWVGVLGGLG